MAVSLPEGNVTILFTDIEDSARIKRQPGIGAACYKEEMLDPHFERLRKCLADHQGHENGTPAGDSIMAVFQNPDEALACAKAIQEDLAAEPIECLDAEGKIWRITVRIGIHCSEKHLKTGDYNGTDTDFAARVMSLGKGEQILVSAIVRSTATLERYQWYDWENRYIKSFEDAPETIHEMLWRPGQIAKEPGLHGLSQTFRIERNRYISRPTLEASVRTHFNKLCNNGEKARLVTLYGFGGMGKTRLAVTVALQVAGAFKDGVYFISLDERLPTAQSVVEAIGAVLELDGSPAVLADLLPCLRNRKSLLLLDNYEPIQCEEVRHFLRDLLCETNHLHLLVTGREAVKISDYEQSIEISGLTDDEAVALFLARAQLLCPDWQPSMEDECTALREILTLTECVPLALELTAAHCKQTVRDIANTLHSTPLPALPQGYILGSAIDQHQALGRCFDWSYKQLSPEAQKTLACISLFVDTFSDETVEQACILEHVGNFLSELLVAALLVTSEIAGHTRYALLLPTRAYARQKFHQLTDATYLRNCYINFYRRLIINNDNINDHAKTAILELEWRNARSAAELAREQRDAWALFGIASGLAEFLGLYGFWSEREQISQDALDTAYATGLSEIEGYSLELLSAVYQHQERWDKALEYYRQSMEIYRQCQDRVGEERVYFNMGSVYDDLGDWDNALNCYRRSLEMCREFQDEAGVGKTLWRLGDLYQHQERWDKALEYYQQSLDVYSELQEHVGKGTILWNITGVKHEQGDVEKALDYARLALQAFEQTPDENSIRLLRKKVASLEDILTVLPRPVRRLIVWLRPLLRWFSERNETKLRMNEQR